MLETNRIGDRNRIEYIDADIVYRDEVLEELTIDEVGKDGKTRRHSKPPDAQEWTAPREDRALRERRQSIYGDGKLSWWRTNYLDFAQLGVGTMLYLCLLKWLAVFFLVQSLISLPALVLFSSGNGMSRLLREQYAWSMTSLGNFHSESADFLSAILQEFVVMEWNKTSQGGVDVDSKASRSHAISYTVSLLDVLNSLLFLGFTLFLRRRVREITEEADTKLITPKDFTVFVEGLPPCATKADIIKHFSDLYRLDVPDWTWHQGGYPNKKARRPVKKPRWAPGGKKMEEAVLATPVSDNSNAGGEKIYLGSWVCEVVLGNIDREVILKCMSRKNLIYKLRDVRARVAYLQRNAAGNATALEREFDRLHDLQEKMRDLKSWLVKFAVGSSMSERKDTSQQKICAFVVFKYHESFSRCLEDYSKMSWTYHPPTPLLFQGKHRLTVSRAEEPTNIKWENLRVPRLQTLLWRFIVHTASLVLLGAGFLVLYTFQHYIKQYELLLPNTNLCEIDLPARFQDTYFFNGSVPVPDRRPELDTLCHEVGMIWLGFPGPKTDAFLAEAKRQRHDAISSMTWFSKFDPCDIPCIRPPGAFIRDSLKEVNAQSTKCYTRSVEQGCPSFSLNLREANQDALCRARFASQDISQGATVWQKTLDGFESLDELAHQLEGVNCCKPFALEATMVSCYCSSQYRSSGWSGILFTSLGTGDEALCSEQFQDKLRQELFRNSPAFVLVILNLLLRVVIRKLSALERHRTVTEQEVSIVSRVFVSQFLNTGFLILLIHASFPSTFTDDSSPAPFFNGEFSDLTRAWYGVVGQTIIYTVAINVVSQYVYPLLRILLIEPVLQYRARMQAVSQFSLNQAYRAMTFSIARRYTEMLCMTFVVIMYSASLPILLPLACLYFGSAFFFYKFGLLRFFEKPPAFDDTLPRLVVNVLPVAQLLHSAIAFWAFGNSTIMPSATVWDISPDDDMLDSNRVRIITRAAQVAAFPQFLLTLLIGVFVAGKFLSSSVSSLAFTTWLITRVGAMFKITGLPKLFSPNKVAPEQTQLENAVRKAKASHKPCFTKFISKRVMQLLGLSSKWESASMAEDIPAFTEPFIRQVSKHKVHSVVQKQLNWKLSKDQDGNWLEFRVWGAEQKSWKARSLTKRDQIMRTWEVIAACDIHTYKMSANPAYEDVPLALNALQARARRKSIAKHNQK